jgi:hypothetical protein
MAAPSAAFRSAYGVRGLQELESETKADSRPYVVEGMIPTKSVNIAVGDSGLGKSPWAYQMALVPSMVREAHWCQWFVVLWTIPVNQSPTMSPKIRERNVQFAVGSSSIQGCARSVSRGMNPRTPRLDCPVRRLECPGELGELRIHRSWGESHARACAGRIPSF